MKLPARELAGLSLGIEMVLSVVLAGAAGRWADRRFGTEPKLLLLGVVIGAAAGFRQIWRYMQRMDRLSEREEAEKQSRPEAPKNEPK